MDNKINQQPVQDEPPTPPPVSGKASSILPLIGVSIATLLIGFVGGFLFSPNNSITSTNLLAKLTPTTIPISPSHSPILSQTPIATVPEPVGANLEEIKYALPATWSGKIEDGALILAPKSGGGYLSVKVYDYTPTTEKTKFYCDVSKICIENKSKFTEIEIGNISGFMATILDNSGGGSEYFGSKGNKFYVISGLNPPSPNDFENNFEPVLGSLVF